MIETIGVAGLIILVALLTYFGILQKVVMAVGHFLAKLGK